LRTLGSQFSNIRRFFIFRNSCVCIQKDDNLSLSKVKDMFLLWHLLFSCWELNHNLFLVSLYRVGCVLTEFWCHAFHPCWELNNNLFLVSLYRVGCVLTEFWCHAFHQGRIGLGTKQHELLGRKNRFFLVLEKQGIVRPSCSYCGKNRVDNSLD
jgi:hypothetical protein